MKLKWLSCLLLSAMLLGGLGFYRYSAQAQVICGSPTECINSVVNNTCIKTGTSLPSIDVNSGGQWYVQNAGSHCGARRKWGFLTEECGPPLSSRLCTFAERTTA